MAEYRKRNRGYLAARRRARYHAAKMKRRGQDVDFEDLLTIELDRES